MYASFTLSNIALRRGFLIGRTSNDASFRSRASLWVPDGQCSTSYSVSVYRFRRRCITAAAQPVLQDPAASLAPEQTAQLEVQPETQRRVKRRSQEVQSESPVLYPSTWQHRAWTWGTIGLLAATAISGSTQVHDAQSVLAALSAVLFGYYLSGENWLKAALQPFSTRCAYDSSTARLPYMFSLP